MLRRAYIVFIIMSFVFCNGAFTADVQDASTNEVVVLDSILVRKMPLRKFAELLTRGCGGQWKVLVSENAAEKKISFYLENIEVEETLKAVCSSYGLWFKRDRGSKIVQIMTVDEFRRGVNLYADETVEVLTIKYPSAEEVGLTLQNLFQDRVVWTPPATGSGDQYNSIKRALKRMDIIADRATLTGDDNDSGDDDDDDDNDNSDNDYDSSDNISQAKQTDIEQVVSKQSKALSALRQTLDDPLSKWGATENGKYSLRPGLVYISVLPASNDLVFRSGDPTSLQRVKQVAVQLDKPRPQVLLEVKVLEVVLDDEHARGFDWLFKLGPVSGGWARGTGNGTGNTIFHPHTDQGLVPSGSTYDSRAAVFSVVTDNIKARLQFLQENSKVTSLATPNLLVADNEASRVFIGTETTVLEKVESTTSYQGTDTVTPVVTYNVEAPRKKIGTTLLITPKIHADRSVTIRILQEESSLGDSKDIVYGYDDATKSEQKFKSQDVDERSVTTTVVAKDGNIVVVGGLIREEVTEEMIGFPGLHKIPVIKEFTRRVNRTQKRTELMVLIRPYVLLAPGEAEDISMDFLSKNSINPSATKATPSLGTSKKTDVRLGEYSERKRRALEKLKDKSRVWNTEP